MSKILLNVYLAFAFIIFGPEALAKNLPMKKVQTVETVWVPMDPSEVEVPEEGIEAVEIQEGHQGAVPLFKEASTQPPQQEVQKVAIQDLPKVLVKEPEKGKEDQRPIIQVIYQGGEVAPQVIEPPVEKKTEPPVEVKKEEPEPMKGDTYNFYFQS